MPLTTKDIFLVEEIIAKKLDERDKIITIGRTDLNELNKAVKSVNT